MHSNRTQSMQTKKREKGIMREIGCGEEIRRRKRIGWRRKKENGDFFTFFLTVRIVKVEMQRKKKENPKLKLKKNQKHHFRPLLLIFRVIAREDGNTETVLKFPKKKNKTNFFFM